MALRAHRTIFMLHELKLQPEFFRAITLGTKKIECRLFDEKRQQISLGDTVVFRCEPELTETVTTEVVGLLRYKTFSDLFADFTPDVLGVNDKVALEKLIYTFYSKEDEARYGVVGIRVAQ